MTAPNLMTVEAMVRGVRTLLLDKIKPYRYSDVSLVAALNITLNEARRVRADLFICRYGIEVPQYDAVTGEVIPVDSQFRLALEYGTAGHALMRDQEDVQDERATAFTANFYNMLLGTRQAPMTGATPTPAGGSKQQAVPRVG